MNLALLAVTALPFVLTPGASFSLTLSAATTGDRWASVKVWAGTSLGISTIAAVAGLSGLAQLVSGSNAARTIFGVVGGIVLLALGVKSSVKIVRASKAGQPAGRANPKVLLWAFLTLIVNVKALSLTCSSFQVSTAAVSTAAVSSLLLHRFTW